MKIAALGDQDQYLFRDDHLATTTAPLSTLPERPMIYFKPVQPKADFPCEVCPFSGFSLFQRKTGSGSS